MSDFDKKESLESLISMIQGDSENLPAIAVITEKIVAFEESLSDDEEMPQSEQAA